MFTQILILTLLVALPYLIVIFRNLIWDIYLWQVKEYRWDRVFSQWMYEKDKGLRTALGMGLRIAFLVLVIAYYFRPQADALVIALIMAFFMYWFEASIFLSKLYHRKVLRPNIRSIRNILIAGLSVLIISLPLIAFCLWLANLNYATASATVFNELGNTNDFVKSVLPRDNSGYPVLSAEYTVVLFVTFYGLMADLLGPLWVMLGVVLTWPLSAIKRKLIVNKAKELMKHRSKLKVVAVTGSYGKSTTKELIYQILSKKFKTVKTEKNNNTDIGIAQTILKKINKDTEVFVAEMGAYKIGETRDCCRIAQPDIAIITGVDQQHVSLFGGISQVIASTYEVVAELKNSGLAILNGDNEYCLKIAEKTNKRKMLYFSIHNASKLEASEISFEDEEDKYKIKHKISFPANENVFVKAIEFTKRGIAFKLNFDAKLYEITTNLKAIYNVSNLLSAILTAHELGMTMKEISKIINEMDFDVPYLNIFPGVNKSRILDDGYNANPTGFIAALKYFKTLKIKTKKWVMTQGMIELGPEREATNKKLAEEIVATSDAFYTTDRALFEQVKLLKPDFEAVLVKTVFDFSIYYENLVHADHVVLIEGAFPQDVLKKIYASYLH